MNRINRAFEGLMTAIERGLALALIAAICLSFANAIGRYGFGRSIMSADEIQIYIMIWITFLGAAVVTWRGRHLRMDIVAQSFPKPLQSWLHFAELLLLLILGAFTLVQSFFYVRLMIVLGRTSDTAGIPMWIPHGAVALGFGLVTLIAFLRAVERLQALIGKGTKANKQTEPTR